MILVDTSVWIDHFQGRSTAQTQFLSEAVDKNVDLCLCGMVLTEILQGIQNEREYRSTRSALENLIFLPTSMETYILAADIYRSARSKGESIRNTIDCLIAACAISHHVPLLQHDRDYSVIAKFSKLKLIQVQ